MDATRNAEVLDGMRSTARRMTGPVTEFAEAMRALDIRVGLHNYVGFEGEPVVMVVAREGRAAELEKLVDELLGDKWQADSLA